MTLSERRADTGGGPSSNGTVAIGESAVSTTIEEQYAVLSRLYAEALVLIDELQARVTLLPADSSPYGEKQQGRDLAVEVEALRTSLAVAEDNLRAQALELATITQLKNSRAAAIAASLNES